MSEFNQIKFQEALIEKLLAARTRQGRLRSTRAANRRLRAQGYSSEQAHGVIFDACDMANLRRSAADAQE